jgi:hypothetical protein
MGGGQVGGLAGQEECSLTSYSIVKIVVNQWLSLYSILPSF